MKSCKAIWAAYVAMLILVPVCIGNSNKICERKGKRYEKAN